MPGWKTEAEKKRKISPPPPPPLFYHITKNKLYLSPQVLMLHPRYARTLQPKKTIAYAKHNPAMRPQTMDANESSSERCIHCIKKRYEYRRNHDGDICRNTHFRYLWESGGGSENHICLVKNQRKNEKDSYKDCHCQSHRYL